MGRCPRLSLVLVNSVYTCVIRTRQFRSHTGSHTQSHIYTLGPDRDSPQVTLAR